MTSRVPEVDGEDDSIVHEDSIGGIVPVTDVDTIIDVGVVPGINSVEDEFYFQGNYDLSIMTRVELIEHARKLKIDCINRYEDALRFFDEKNELERANTYLHKMNDARELQIGSMNRKIKNYKDIITEQGNKIERLKREIDMNPSQSSKRRRSNYP